MDKVNIGIDNVSSISDVSLLIEKTSAFYNEQVGARKKIEENKTEKINEFSEIIEKRDELMLKKSILKEASTEARKNAGELLDGMATNAIQTIMSDKKRVQTVFDENKSPTTADIFVFEKQSDGREVDTDPTEEDGGGVADIVSLADFLAFSELTKNTNKAPLVLDEPSKYVSKAYRDAVADFLYEMSHYFKRQVFMSTHDEALIEAGDKVYYLKKNLNGRTILLDMDNTSDRLEAEETIREVKEKKALK